MMILLAILAGLGWYYAWAATQDNQRLRLLLKHEEEHRILAEGTNIRLRTEIAMLKISGTATSRHPTSLTATKVPHLQVVT